MLQKILSGMILVSSLTISLNANNCRSEQLGFSMYETCKSMAMGSGEGAGLGMFLKGYKIKQMPSNKYLAKCFRSFENQSEYSSKFQRVYINACLSTVNLQLK